MKKPKQMSGVLAAPIKVKHSELLAAHLVRANNNEAAIQASTLLAASISEVDGKIKALAKHYGLDAPVESDLATAAMQYRALLVALASDFVPGFQEPVKKGRPSKWDTLAGRFLVADIDRHIVPGDSTKGVAYASAQCAKRAHWKLYVGEVDSVEETIRKGYEAATKFLAKLPSILAITNTDCNISQAEWDEHVQGVVEYELSKQYGEN